MAQLGRDRGRQKQPVLWSQWGGAPTTERLRFRGNANRELLLRRRSKLEQLLGHDLPTEREEVEDPSKADSQYESAVAYLLEATRDAQRFRLVLEENINYGFRRNLWGLKPYGLAIAGVAVGGTWALLGLHLATGLAETTIYQRLFVSPDAILALRVLGALVNTAILGLWLAVVNPGWVKTTAEAYAERLLGALDSL